jgi:hypothetical protein
MSNGKSEKTAPGKESVRIVRHWSYRGYDADVHRYVIGVKKEYLGTMNALLFDVPPHSIDWRSYSFKGTTLRKAKKSFKQMIDRYYAYLEKQPKRYAVCIQDHGVTCCLCKQWKIPLTPEGRGNYGTFDEDPGRAILFGSREAAQNEALRYDDSFVEEL